MPLPGSIPMTRVIINRFPFGGGPLRCPIDGRRPHRLGEPMRWAAGLDVRLRCAPIQRHGCQLLALRVGTMCVVDGGAESRWPCLFLTTRATDPKQNFIPIHNC
jgi:hypothetical protein